MPISRSWSRPEATFGAKAALMLIPSRRPSRLRCRHERSIRVRPRRVPGRARPIRQVSAKVNALLDIAQLNLGDAASNYVAQDAAAASSYTTDLISDDRGF